MVAGGNTADTVKKIIGKVPDSTKEDMIVQVVNYKTDRTVRKLEDFAAEKGIRIKIRDVSARKF